MAVFEHALMQAGEKIVKVQAALVRVGQGLEKTIEQPAFAAADRSMQVQAAGLAAFQAGGLGCHVFDDLQLAETQGVALGGGLGAKILTNAVSTVDFVVRHSPEASAQGT
ncbi:hypothetical protein D9M71_723020 [compost metagenome]